MCPGQRICIDWDFRLCSVLGKQDGWIEVNIPSSGHNNVEYILFPLFCLSGLFNSFSETEQPRPDHSPLVVASDGGGAHADDDDGRSVLPN